MDRKAAFASLCTFETELLNRLPDPTLVRLEVGEAVHVAKSDETRKHQRQAEDAFLYRFVYPTLFRHVRSVVGKEGARESMLSEYYRNMDGLCSMSPARRVLHPFTKTLGVRPAEVLARWQGEGARLWQACPDFALRAPFPHGIVFEGKYFEKGGPSTAERTLVNSIHEAFSYRALPPMPPSGAKLDPGWNYDYGCLLAYDASPEGDLRSSWDALPEDVRRSFWDGGNVFVMILRGKNGKGRQILHIGAEGGSLTVSKAVSNDSKVEYLVTVNENQSEGDAAQPVPARSLEDALEYMDRYPWPKLFPLDVAPDVEAAVLDAVETRAGAKQRARWEKYVADMPS